MPICITCSTPVKNLYTTYSKADDRALGKGVRLTQCPKCKNFADKYVEHDFVVLFIDLVLIKPQVYRHLLFNRLGRSDDKLDPSILRLGILLVLFDVYITWARIEKANAGRATASRLAEAPILTQYLFFLTMNILATVAQHAVIRFLARWWFTSQPSRMVVTSPDQSALSPAKSPSGFDDEGVNKAGKVYAVRPGHASPNAISTALLVSSCTKLFPILLVIWPSETKSNDSLGWISSASNYVGWAVLLNNIEALLILLDCGYVVGTGLAIAGLLARWIIDGWVLSLVGMNRHTGSLSDLLSLGQTLWQNQ